MRLRSFLSNTQSLAFCLGIFHPTIPSPFWLGVVWNHLVVIYPFWNSSSPASDSWRRTPWATPCMWFFFKEKMPHNILKVTLIADSRLPSKCDFSFWVFLSISWISQSKITQIKWSCTISNSQRKGLFENVQNFFWWCFLNREIAETKVERVLRDTLYVICYTDISPVPK